ncbi:MAG: TolC family outer membrane protein [Chromatiaceae bacterium]|nr:TolC family outer membrane protein [Chromatiaceae bacterium]MCP5443982.1 TolC family outer membrane protein [Chromatiaceae bacterium]
MSKKVKTVSLLVSMLTVAGPSAAYTLTEAVQRALETHPEVLAETSQYLSRQQELEQARSGYYPKVDVSAGIGYELSDNNATRTQGYDDRELTRKEANIVVDQMLFDGYAVSSEVTRQDARVRAQQHTIQGSGQQVALEAIDAYLKVLLNRTLVALSTDNLSVHDRILDQVSLRTRAGVGRSSDLEQVTGRRAAAVSSLLSDQVNLQDAESGFLSVVGDLPRELAPAAEKVAGLPDNLDAAVRTGLDNHPTLKSADADVDAAKAQSQAARNGFYPKFNLELGGTWNDDLDGVEGRDHDLTAMIRMRYNLYSGGRDQARVRQTEELINQAKDVRNRTRRQVVESMRLSWSAYKITGDQLDYLRRHISATEYTRDAYAEQFRLGQRTLLDLLNTENEVFQARRSYQTTLHDHLFAQYRILAAMGALMETLGVSGPSGDTDRAAIDEQFSGIATESALDAEIRAQRARLHEFAPSTPSR